MSMNDIAKCCSSRKIHFGTISDELNANLEENFKMRVFGLSFSECNAWNGQNCGSGSEYQRFWWVFEKKNFER